MTYVEQEQKTNRTMWMVLGAIVVAGIIGIVILMNGRNKAAEAQAEADAAVQSANIQAATQGAVAVQTADAQSTAAAIAAQQAAQQASTAAQISAATQSSQEAASAAATAASRAQQAAADANARADAAESNTTSGDAPAGEIR